MKISQTSPNLNNYNGYTSNPKMQATNNLSFKALPTAPTAAAKAVEKAESKFFKPLKDLYHKVMKPVNDLIQKGFIKLIESKPAEKIITATENNAKFKDKLFSHLIVIGSTILSGFYVIKTLSNKKLDDERKRTLAINQTAVYILSTICAYTVDGALNKKAAKIVEKYKRLNPITEVPNVEKQVKGIGRAKSIMVIDTIYRFIAPVIVTPLANYIGNKLIEREENKKA